MRLLKYDQLSYKVNKNMSQISVVRLRGRIEGAAVVTFISLVRFRNQLMNKKILNLLHSRRVTKRTPHVLIQVCAEACAIACLSVISLLVHVCSVQQECNNYSFCSFCHIRILTLFLCISVQYMLCTGIVVILYLDFLISISQVSILYRDVLLFSEMIRGMD